MTFIHAAESTVSLHSMRKTESRASRLYDQHQGLDVLASLSARAREALKLVASNPHGATEAFMYSHGFSLRMLIGVVRRRVATVQKERVNAGAKPVKVVRIRITDAGLRALKD